MKKPINPLIAALVATLPGMNRARKGAEQAAAPGIEDLPRPADWPRLMAWPPGDLLHQYGLADAARKKQIREQLEAYTADMKKRAAAARAWLLETHKSAAPRGASSDLDGIMFASLVVPGGVPPALGQIVAKWGFDTIVTRDGGELHASLSELKIRRGSPEAVQALVIEAKKRGWASIEVSGSRAFKKQVALEAAKFGLPVRTRDAAGKSVLLSTGQPEIEKQLAAQATTPKSAAAPTPDPKTGKGAPVGPASPVTPAPGPSGRSADTTAAGSRDPKIVTLDQHRNRAQEGPSNPDPEPRPA